MVPLEVCGDGQTTTNETKMRLVCMGVFWGVKLIYSGVFYYSTMLTKATASSPA